MRVTSWVLATVTLGLAVLAGCGGDDPFDPNKKRRDPAMGLGGQLAPADLPGQGGVSDKTKKGKGTGTDSSLPPPPPTAGPAGGNASPPPPPPPTANPNAPAPNPNAPAQPDPNVQRIQVQPGITGKGQGYGRGPIATPVRTYFMVRERVVFDQVAQALNLYRAETGHFPKTQEEFWEKVVKKNGLVLPKLRDAEDKYVYLPEKLAKVSTCDPYDLPMVVERPQRGPAQ